VPVRMLMTWDPANRRWRKLYRGQRYVVSCRQLEVPETKEASFRAANEWWERKRAELEGHQPAHPFQATIAKLEERKAWAQHHEPAVARFIQGQIEELAGLEEGDLPPSVVREGFLGSPEAQLVWRDRLAHHRPDPIPEVQTIRGQVERWLASQEAKVRAGLMAPGSLRNNADCVAHFRAFVGDESPVQAIDEDRLEAYFSHLIGRIGSISRDYALKCFGVSKAFIRYCVEKGLIPYPKNFESRSFRFNVTAKPVPTLTVEEFHLLLKHATGQMPLHLLLMANCGMTQLDIAELRDAEVDWSRGRITRKRSKTERHEQVPTVNYKLWPRTFELLGRFRSGADIVLLTEAGGRWVYEEHVEGKLRSSDNIASNFKWLKDRVWRHEGVRFKKPLRQIRKTSATLIGGSEKYGRFTQHFLGHSPRTIADRHYVAPSQELFDEAVKWLGERYGV
jgi:integrase